MRKPDLFFDQTRLFEHLCSENELRIGFRAVKANKGSAGTDGVSIDQFESHLEEELGQLQKELKSWSYKPHPVRRVDIPKALNPNEYRMLGIPSVRDRVVQATLKNLLEPIFEVQFSDNSYGFRPGRNQEQAVKAAQDIVARGKEFCVDIDLSKFFDRVNHDRLIGRLGQTLKDKRILKVIGIILRSGILANGIFSPTTEGTTQGSPLSPLLSNIVLDELDQELECRGLEFCRYADDCNIFVGSQKAAERAMANTTGFIEGKLKLQVNTEKSKVAPACQVKFLGMTIVAKTLAISAGSMKRAMQKVKELLPVGSNETLEQSLERVNQWYVGWSNYYKMTYYPSQLKGIEAHIRRRFRSRFVEQARGRKNLVKKLVKRGVSDGFARRTAYSNCRRWALSHTRAVEQAFSTKWFEGKGLRIMSNKALEHWFELDRWIRLS